MKNICTPWIKTPTSFAPQRTLFTIIRKTAFEEYEATALLTGILEANGFRISRGAAGIPTAFTATYGTGKVFMVREGVFRDVDAKSVHELHARVDRIAQGAALMTDTSVKSEVVSGYSNLITIPALQAAANEAMHDIPLPIPTEEEIAYGRALQETMPPRPPRKKRSRPLRLKCCPRWPTAVPPIPLM